MKGQTFIRSAVIVGTIAGVSALHYQTATSYLWLHQLFQRGYYVPVLLGALWFGWRGGLLTAALAGFLYAPHILLAWKAYPAYSAAQFIEIVMFFAIGALAGVLADRERSQRRKVEETARMLAEANIQLQASFDQLRRADRLSALGQLAAGLAHEVRNPLGSIEGALQILQRPGLLKETQQEFGKLAQEEVNRLKRLVSDFLDFARPQTPRRRSTELSDLLEGVNLLAAETARRARIRLRTEFEGSLPAIQIDPEQIKQVLLNLVINAVQAMPSGGEIVLRAVKRADSVTLEVQDEGVGIESENLERIFDPFFTTRDDGTGLGLSIAYQIVDRHGGNVRAIKNRERGMTFAVTLPLQEETTPITSGTLGKWA